MRILILLVILSSNCFAGNSGKEACLEFSKQDAKALDMTLEDYLSVFECTDDHMKEAGSDVNIDDVDIDELNKVLEMELDG